MSDKYLPRKHAHSKQKGVKRKKTETKAYDE